MITIIKKEIKISEELLSKIRWACTFSKTNPKIINGALRIIKHTNLAYVEPHKVIINDKQLNDYIQRLNKEFEVEYYELFSKNVNKNKTEIELKLNKEKQKLIRLVAVKSDKNFSKCKKENYEIGAIISKKITKNNKKILLERILYLHWHSIKQ